MNEKDNMMYLITNVEFIIKKLIWVLVIYVIYVHSQVPILTRYTPNFYNAATLTELSMLTNSILEDESIARGNFFNKFEGYYSIHHVYIYTCIYIYTI